MTSSRRGRPRRTYPRPALYRSGSGRVFRGEALRAIAFPLGGIGTGTISLGGYGQLRDWEIFNRPAKGETLPYSFFAIWMQERGQAPITRVLEGRRPPPYTAAWGGLPPDQVWGLPRFAKATFSGLYPFARVALSDPQLPVNVRLDAFNPFIPLNELDSSLPVAILRYTVHNRSRRSVAVSVVGSLLNAVGYQGREPPQGRRHESFGRNRNEFVRQSPIAGLRMTSAKPGADAAGFGSMALATTHPGQISYLTHWLRGEHWDDMQAFWEDFAHDGRVEGDQEGVSADGEAEHGSLAASATIQPGRRESFTFLIAWHFPNRTYDRNPVGWPQHFHLRNWYADRFPDAWSVAWYTAENLQRLQSQTTEYTDTLSASTLPGVVLDAAGSQVSILRTPTVFRTDDGRLYGYEGTRDASGSCPMNCTHVWNYEQALAFLFPSLERTLRETDFGVNTRKDGHMAFRTLLPLSERLWEFKPAADGQMGCILKLYREWQISGDRKFLTAHWPAAKRVIEFAWKKKGWDADRDGVMEGEQHNTYDIEFYGSNTMTSTLYLAALKAAAIMARELGDTACAERYEELFQTGSGKLDAMLFNGKWYVQKGVDTAKTKYQFGPGCLSDQLLGQWFCEVVGLGYVLPRAHVRRTLRSIFEHNWKRDLTEHHSVQRTYALNDEAGLLLCTWPAGGRPPLPFIYADEVWTGVEYQVAAHLFYEGFVDEGLVIVKGVRDRYDGLKRNPWDEFECGHHYARALASWSLILALSGYRYSAPHEAIGFSPRITPEKFACFYSTGTGWGLFKQSATRKIQSAELILRYGRLTLREVELTWARKVRPPRAPAVIVKANRRAIYADATTNRGTVTVRFREPIALNAGQRLTIRLSY